MLLLLLFSKGEEATGGKEAGNTESMLALKRRAQRSNQTECREKAEENLSVDEDEEEELFELDWFDASNARLEGELSNSSNQHEQRQYPLSEEEFEEVMFSPKPGWGVA